MISIVIPAYEMKNQGVDFLRRAFDSINKQLLDPQIPIEVIVSDQSTDAAITQFTASYPCRFPVRHMPQYAQYGNLSYNLNVAIKAARYPYIKILFQDDFLVEADYLAKLSSHLAQSPGDAILTAATHTADSLEFYDELIPQNNPFLVFGHNTVSSPSVLTIARTFWEKEPFDEHLRLLMDCDFMFRLFEHGKNVTILPSIHIANGVWQGQTQHDLIASHLVPEIDYLLVKHASHGLTRRLDDYETFLEDHNPALALRLKAELPVFSPPATPPMDVLVSAYEDPRHLAACIKSVLLQETPANRIWVIPSAENAADIEKLVNTYFSSYPQITIAKPIPVASDLADFAAWFAVSKLSTAPYLAFLNAANKWAPNHLNRLWSCLKQSSAQAKTGSVALGCISATQPSELRPMGQEVLCDVLLGHYWQDLGSSLLIERQAFVLSCEKAIDFLQLQPKARHLGQWHWVVLLASTTPLIYSDQSTQAIGGLPPKATTYFSQRLLTEKHLDQLGLWQTQSLLQVQDFYPVLEHIRQYYLDPCLSGNTSGNPSLRRRFMRLKVRLRRLLPHTDPTIFKKACGSVFYLYFWVLQYHLMQWTKQKRAVLFERFPFTKRCYRGVAITLGLDPFPPN